MPGHVLLVLASASFAADSAVVTQAFRPAPIAGHPVLDFRVGGQTGTPLDHPVMCLEAYPLARFSIEACGNGAGFLHHDDVSDLAHFRIRGTMLEGLRKRTSAALVLGAGFAELSVGEDEGGFQFGPADSPAQRSGAGPEVSLSGKMRHWFDRRGYFVVDLNAGVALIASAPTVADQAGPTVGFVSATAGLGF